MRTAPHFSPEGLLALLIVLLLSIQSCLLVFGQDEEPEPWSYRPASYVERLARGDRPDTSAVPPRIDAPSTRQRSSAWGP